MGIVQTLEIDRLSEWNLHSHLTSDQDEFEHNHAFYEIFYVTTGTITHLAEGTRQVLRSGDGYLIVPGYAHSFLRNHGECTHRDVLIYPQFFRECCDFLDKGLAERLQSMRYCPFHFTAEEIGIIDDEFINFFGEFSFAQRIRYEKILMIDFLKKLVPSSAQKIHRDPENFHKKCIAALYRDFTLENYMDALVKELGYNKIYLCKKFKSTFGKTIGEYVREVRLQAAEDLLRNSQWSAAKICASVGFESYPYFNRIFKERYGMTPIRYRASDPPPVSPAPEK